MLVVKNGIDPITETLYVAEEIEHHFHNSEIWIGNGVVEDSLTGYSLVSGNADFGAETLILDTGSTPLRTGKRFFDMHTISVLALSSSTVYIVRIIWGTGTVAAAESAKQYTTTNIKSTGIGANISAYPLDVRFPKLPVGTKVWVKIKNATNLATMTALFGVHEYYE